MAFPFSSHVPPGRPKLLQLILTCIVIFLIQARALDFIPVRSNFGPSFPANNVSNAATAETLEAPFPYIFPQLGQNPARLFPMPDCNGFVLEEATIDQLQIAMGKGQLTSVQIALCYLQRIQQTNEYVK